MTYVATDLRPADQEALQHMQRIHAGRCGDSHATQGFANQHVCNGDAAHIGDHRCSCGFRWAATPAVQEA